MKYLVTGGAGFIGSAVIRRLITETEDEVCSIDALTYAGHCSTVAAVEGNDRYRFIKANICDGAKMHALITAFAPDIILNFAAESHVDRSIDGPAAFINTNILGTYTLLEAARDYWHSLNDAAQSRFRFQHISTDEVYGSLGPAGTFDENTPYRPNSPYSASKAASDHLVRAWGQTYGLPVIITNCSNNYGPFQFPEKLIPLMIINALERKPLPVYGTGKNVRDWLYVDDHARGLIAISRTADAGSAYNLGGNAERTNLDVVKAICQLLDAAPTAGCRAHEDLIEFVEDRPGHDARYAIDASKVKADIGWTPLVGFEEGLEKTVNWYLDNRTWWEMIRREKQYQGERLGAGHSRARKHI